MELRPWRELVLLPISAPPAPREGLGTPPQAVLMLGEADHREDPRSGAPLVAGGVQGVNELGLVVGR